MYLSLNLAYYVTEMQNYLATSMQIPSKIQPCNHLNSGGSPLSNDKDFKKAENKTVPKGEALMKPHSHALPLLNFLLVF